MSQSARPSIAAVATIARPSPINLLDKVLEQTSRGFDAEAFHVMDRRDDKLISEEVINGASSGKFVYAFVITGTAVSGVSVVGARHLAYEYGGLRCAILSSVEKTGNLWLFRTFPASGKFEVRPERFRELEDEPDFYEVMLELSDIKTGNSIQVTKRETRMGQNSSGKPYDKPHYRTIAEAKAFRNGILSLLPQDVILKFKAKNLPLAQAKIDIGDDVIAEKRAGVLQFAAAKGVPVDRHALEALTMDQIAGLAEAARTKDAAQFVNAASALGLIQVEQVEQVEQAPVEPPKPRQTRQKAAPAEPPHDPVAGEIEREASKVEQRIVREQADERPQPPDDGELF